MQERAYLGSPRYCWNDYVYESQVVISEEVEGVVGRAEVSGSAVFSTNRHKARRRACQHYPQRKSNPLLWGDSHVMCPQGRMLIGVCMQRE